MLKISWKNKVTNVSVLEKVNEERSTLNTIWQWKHRWLGQVLRSEVLQRDVIEGRMKDKACQGIKRLHYAEWPCLLSKVSGSEKSSKKHKDGELQREG